MISNGLVEDRLAIRELRERFADSVTHRHAEAWIGTWTEDAYWRIPSLGIEASGKDAIFDLWQKAMDVRAFVAFFAFPGPLVVDGDYAHGPCYYQEIQTMKDGHKRFVIGFYTDDMAKQAGSWRFKRRVYKVLYDADKGVMGHAS